MLHDWVSLAVLHLVAEDPAPVQPTTSILHDVVVALIGAAAPLLGVMVPLLLTIRGRNRANTPDPDLSDKLERYERFMYRQSIDPERIITGNEEISDVRLV